MSYIETIKYLYDSTPVFQKEGQAAYKEGLDNTLAFDEHFGHPHRQYKTIHIAGTNGKGSCAHTLAAVLQSAGYKTGLYTSPHLVDFRERIRINGQPISEDYVVNFVDKERRFFEPLHPSFFEITTAMALKYFADEQVDIAVIEVGLGGRLDCTNIIRPILSVITNISFDHVQFLGHTLDAIAEEKAGIMKQGVPVVIGEYTEETRKVFEDKSKEAGAPLCFAEDHQEICSYQADYKRGGFEYVTKTYGKLHGELGGLCQEKNTNTILNAISQLKKSGLKLSKKDVRQAFENVCSLTGLMGRWQTIKNEGPTVVCDTGHNEGGFKYIARQLKAQTCEAMRIIIGMVNDKDVRAVLALLPKNAIYYFTKASVKRAIDENELKNLAEDYGLKGKTYQTVVSAYQAAISDSQPHDFVYIGGSSYVVADFLTFFMPKMSTQD